MKKLFPLIMGLSVLLSSSSLVSAFIAIPNKNNHPQVKTPPSNRVNLDFDNRAETETFGQREYGEENFALTIWMSGDMWTYWNETIYEMNPSSDGAGEKFYQLFLGDTHLGNDAYDKKWKIVKEEVETELKARAEEKHPTETFEKKLYESNFELPGGWINFWQKFTGEFILNNIYPDEEDTTDERQDVYRRDGQVLQWAFIRKNQQQESIYFIPYFNVRVFPNTEIVNDSGILNYWRGVRIDGSRTWATCLSLVVKLRSSQHGYRIKKYSKAVLATYARTVGLSIKKEKSLEFDQTWDNAHDHPEFYKYEGQVKDPFRRPIKENLQFNITNPHDESKTYQSFGLIALVDVN